MFDEKGMRYAVMIEETGEYFVYEKTQNKYYKGGVTGFIDQRKQPMKDFDNFSAL
jgi:hypothetical protein